MKIPKKVLGKGLKALMPQRTIEFEDRAKLDETFNLDVAQIKLGQFQPRERTNPQKMAELIASVREKGIIQPVLVRPIGKDKTYPDSYELIAGERRLRAAKELGFSQVPVIIKDVDNAEALQLALIENIQREDLNALEEARAYQQLTTEFGLSQPEIGRMVGKDTSTISNTMRLLKLPQKIQDALYAGLITMGHARSILSITGLGEQDRLLRRMVDEKLSVREMEHIVANKLIEQGKGKRTKLKVSLRNPLFIDIEEQLQRIFGTKVKIISGHKRGRVVFEYYSSKDLERLVTLLKRTK